MMRNLEPDNIGIAMSVTSIGLRRNDYCFMALHKSSVTCTERPSRTVFMMRLRSLTGILDSYWVDRHLISWHNASDFELIVLCNN